MSGGGVALGPKPRSYRQHTPKKMVRLALLSALSDRAIIGRIAVVDAWGIEEPKTAAAATIVRKLRLTGTVLIVLSADEIAVARSFANLPAVQTTTFAELSAHDVLRADWLLFSSATLPGSPEDFSGTHGTKEDASELEALVEAEAEAEAPAKPKAAKAAKATKAAKPAAAAAPAVAAEPEVTAEAPAPEAAAPDADTAEEADTDA
jgi:large subunit ribosomal protein L4